MRKMGASGPFVTLVMALPVKNGSSSEENVQKVLFLSFLNTAKELVELLTISKLTGGGGGASGGASYSVCVLQDQSQCEESSYYESGGC